VIRAYPLQAMGILDYLLASLSPEAKKELAKEAAERAVKGIGDTVYEKADEVRRDFEDAARKKREAKERAEAEARRERERVEAAAKKESERIEGEKRIEDELAMLKARVQAEKSAKKK
jgi:hypothetical protein